MRVSRNWRVLRVVLAVAICCALTRPGVKAQPSPTYTYTVIADLFNCQAGNPVMNNKGEVAFGGFCGSPIGPAAGALIVLRGDGGPLTTIFQATTTHFPLAHDVLSINDSGVVAFAVNGGCAGGGSTAIRTGDGGPTTTVYDVCTDGGFTSVLRPAISNTGAVAFWTSSGEVVRAKNGALVTIAGAGTTPTSVGTLVAALEPSINNNDVVTFTGQGQTTFGLFTGAGGALTTISLDAPSIFNAIDDSGRVAFLAGNIAVQTGDGGPVTTIATRTFEGGTYESFTQVAISAAGKVVFLAGLPSGVVGVFTGPDPEADVVLKTGDPLRDSLGVLLGTVTSIFITREAINDSGQVAMVVGYNDSEEVPRFAIVRADPPNHPPGASDDSFSVTAGGSVSDTLSATDPDTEPITYSIVTNGTKGTAVIDNPSTGAFTYTANANASGDDTFTFKVTDNRGLESNVATITIAINPAACAVDVTSSVAPVKGKGTKGPSLTHPIALLNTSSSAIVGPVSIALDSLTAGATLLNAAGVTLCAAPAGSPYLNIDLGSDSVWSPGERVDFVLEFAHESTAQGKKPVKITYTQRVLAGAGGR